MRKFRKIAAAAAAMLLLFGMVGFSASALELQSRMEPRASDMPSWGPTSGTCGEDLTWTFDQETGILTISGTGDMGNDSYSRWRDGVTKVVIEDGATSIAHRAFENYTSLLSVTIPDTVTSIGDYAFSNCEALPSITIPDSVTSIGRSAFYNCSSFSSITIPDSVTKIDEWAFQSCSSLTSVTLSENVTSIGRNPFSGTPWFTEQFDNNAFVICNNILIAANNEFCVGDVVIPDGVTHIASSAFYDDFFFPNMTSVVIPGSVTSIGDGAFVSCFGLKEVTIQDGVTSIGDMAFYFCKNMKKVSIPASVTHIGFEAFDSSGLSTIYYYGTEEQWEAIEIEEENKKLTGLHKAAISYLGESTEPTKPTEPTESTEPTPPEDEPVYGDTDCNGTVNLVDVVLLNKNLMVGIELTQQGILNADVDCDGMLSAIDSLNILKFCVDLVTLPVTD